MYNYIMQIIWQGPVKGQLEKEGESIQNGRMSNLDPCIMLSMWFTAISGHLVVFHAVLSKYIYSSRNTHSPIDRQNQNQNLIVTILAYWWLLVVATVRPLYIRTMSYGIAHFTPPRALYHTTLIPPHPSQIPIYIPISNPNSHIPYPNSPISNPNSLISNPNSPIPYPTSLTPRGIVDWYVAGIPKDSILCSQRTVL